MNRAHRFALVLLALPLAAAAEFGDLGASRPSAQDMLRTPPPSPSTVIVVPVAPSRSGGTTYYDDGKTVYGSDGSTATRYGDTIYVVPDSNTTINELLEE
ncbi:hypothetical protein D3C78_1313840 [compost metagenome]